MRSIMDPPHCCHSATKAINTSIAHFCWRMTNKVRCSNPGQCIESNDNYSADVMTVWEYTHVLNADDPYYPAIVGGDVMDNGPAPPLIPSGGLRCQYHVQGRPCGALIEGGAPSILKHFACMHVPPRFFTNARSDRPSKPWICCWDGKCDSRILKGSFKRHVLSHFFRWMCPTCSSPYSRDDSARKHAKGCGNGRIFMQPRPEVCSRQL
ncbi:uncharacterized protein BJ212DRAFT_1307970 [Suillus subaureus]|uniref:Uncharacterized protein n=1 Tax=Suillus subaureus TaxID=48587 RepID=A0A9P7EMY1_9AGAM|nr:uncharacterized protein BJ212DRAFT_1307970 [Suillus subaureus]KAG1826740.1 hypothetical protein BJ212DRAFT_1307970 [Suillus subaureus]